MPRNKANRNNSNNNMSAESLAQFARRLESMGENARNHLLSKESPAELQQLKDVAGHFLKIVIIRELEMRGVPAI